MLKTLFTGATLLLLSPIALADWSLDNDLSRVSFVSVKKNTIGEAHYFKKIAGELTQSGQFSADIQLASVETLIPIRNERMAQYLFNTKLSPTLKLNAALSEHLKTLKTDQSQLLNIPANITLNGINKTLAIDVLTTQLGNGNIIVSSFMPVIINPADFNLTAGIEKLQALAQLPSITQSVPVSFTLTLQKK
ncbi:YceI family protein [Colwellia sp. D2M02]|nr:YceI family protein [Colwellia sp. D2M02]